MKKRKCGRREWKEGGNKYTNMGKREEIKKGEIEEERKSEAVEKRGRYKYGREGETKK